MILDTAIDVLSAVFLILGAFLSLAAGVGLLRFSDAIARMHATTKPQILGLMFFLIALALQVRSWQATLVLGLVMIFQMVTAPISAHMAGRAGYRTGVVAPGSLLVDELEQAIRDASARTEDESER